MTEVSYDRIIKEIKSAISPICPFSLLFVLFSKTDSFLFLEAYRETIVL